MVLRFNGCDRNREFYLYIQLYTQFVNPGADYLEPSNRLLVISHNNNDNDLCSISDKKG